MASESFGYTGSVQTFDATDVESATFTLNGPSGGGESSDNTAGGDGGYIEATIDVSNYSSVDIYVGDGGKYGDSSGAGAGGWGYVNGEQGGGSYLGGGGGLTAVVDPNGNALLKAGGGGGGSNFFGTGGNGADWQSSQADGSPVGGDPHGPGTGEAVDSSASNVTITEGGGTAGNTDADGSPGEVSVTYEVNPAIEIAGSFSSNGTITGVPDRTVGFSGTASGVATSSTKITQVMTISGGFTGDGTLTANLVPVTPVYPQGSAVSTGSIQSRLTTLRYVSGSLTGSAQSSPVLVAAPIFTNVTTLVAIDGGIDAVLAEKDMTDDLLAADYEDSLTGIKNIESDFVANTRFDELVAEHNEHTIESILQKEIELIAEKLNN